MAALYNKTAWNGRDIVLEFCFGDIQKSYQIHLMRDGHRVVTEDFLPYTTRIETPFSVWKRIADGEISGQQAMFDHLYAVKGDFDLMLHWDDYFGYSSQAPRESVPAKGSRKTNMTLLLLPWMLLWIALPINARVGGVLGVLLAAAIPLTYLKWKATVFEYVSILAAAAIGLLSALGSPPELLVPASYGAFGVMWSVSALFKIPLTAYYSMNDYNGERALSNPLFLRTNRILTAAWGILYLLTPIWTWFILRSDAAALSGAINSVLPVLMGIFTAWFQRWYPGHYAQRAGQAQRA